MALLWVLLVIFLGIFLQYLIKFTGLSRTGARYRAELKLGGAALIKARPSVRTLALRARRLLAPRAYTRSRRRDTTSSSRQAPLTRSVQTARLRHEGRGRHAVGTLEFQGLLVTLYISAGSLGTAVVDIFFILLALSADAPLRTGPALRQARRL